MPIWTHAQLQDGRAAADRSADFRGQSALGQALIVPIGSSQRLQMRTRQLIKETFNPTPHILAIQNVVDDPTSILLVGRSAGQVRIVLKGADGTEETYDVIVELNVDFIRSVLQRVAPTANLQVIPTASGTIVISGTASQSEDIDLIMRTAQGLLAGTRAAAGAGEDLVINAMRVGGVMLVQLDAVVAFVSRSELRRMSFDFVNFGQKHVLASTVGGALAIPSDGIAGVFPGGPTIVNSIGQPNGGPANIFLGLFNDKQDFFGFLQALRNENLAKIVSQPSVVTLSGRSSLLLSGGEQAVPEAAGLGTVSVRFQPFGTRLNVLPIVLGNGKIFLEVLTEVSSLDPSVGTSLQGTVVAGRNTQSVTTAVQLEHGQTLAVGGLIQTNINATTQKVPVLGDLPFIGAAFSSVAYNETESELVVLITPRLVDAMDAHQKPCRLPGQETRSPDDFELFLERILEAPRGPRQVFPNGRYVPAWRNDPSAEVFPCGGPFEPRRTGGTGCQPVLLPTPDCGRVERGFRAATARERVADAPGSARPPSEPRPPGSGSLTLPAQRPVDLLPPVDTQDSWLPPPPIPVYPPDIGGGDGNRRDGAGRTGTHAPSGKPAVFGTLDQNR